MISMIFRKFGAEMLALLLMTLSLFSVEPAAGQADSSWSFGADVKTGFGNAGHILSAPLRFSGEDWLITSAVVGGTALCFAVDEPARTYMQEHQSGFGDAVNSFGQQYGSGLNAMLLSGALYAGGAAAGNAGLRETGMMTFESVAIAGSVGLVLKVVIGRSRPYADEGAFRFSGFEFQDPFVSMPSGHTIVAFAMSSTLAARLRSLPATIGLYSLATLTAASRVYADQHWVSDTVLGAAIGTAVGLAVVDLHKESDSGTSFRFMPTPQGLAVGMTF